MKRVAWATNIGEVGAMSLLRQVDGETAGPAALGVLLPPGRRTFLILRPRGLVWDLLLLRSADSTMFRDLTRGEAERAVRTLWAALETWHAGGTGGVEAVACAGLSGFLVRVVLGPLSFLACPREPRRPYRAHVFADAATADVAAHRLASALRPPTGADLEVYVNACHFER
jgi:hypothetical protein